MTNYQIPQNALLKFRYILQFNFILRRLKVRECRLGWLSISQCIVFACTSITSISNTSWTILWKYVIACYPPSFRYFNEFLMAHHRQVAREIKDEYIDTMSKIYFSYFKTYISKLLKLQARKSQYVLFLVRGSITESHQHLPAHVM